MNTVPALIPVSLRAFWQEAWAFCAYVLHRFDRDDLRAGIRRASGVRIAIWLGGAESALRRLILMAALVLTPAPLKPHAARTPTPRVAKARVHGFSVFRLHGSGVSRRVAAPPPSQTPYGHIRFPADPILALGRVARRSNHLHNGGPLLPRVRAKHPLDRWGRLSRNDPDWRAPPERPFVDRSCLETEPDDRDLYGFETVDRIPRVRHKPKRIDSRPDWRRCYDEWEKRVPAPQLAARLDALERIAANPDALIRRTARRLQAGRERTVALARAARPITRLPRRARKVETAGFDQHIAVKLHALMDSS